MTSQNEYHYKLTLKKVISKWVDSTILDDHDLGWMPEEMIGNMVEAAWLIIKSNKDLNEYLKSNDLITN